MVAAQRFGKLVRGLAEDCDVVIVDAPAMLAVGDTGALAQWVDALVYVANPAKLRRPQLERARQQLSKLPCRKLGVVMIAENHRQGYYRHGYYT
jgi:Mrp family chromosome partitioning ATPase